MKHTNRTKKPYNSSPLLVIGIVIFIILLILWLTMADLLGQTDVNMIAFS